MSVGAGVAQVRQSAQCCGGLEYLVSKLDLLQCCQYHTLIGLWQGAQTAALQCMAFFITGGSPCRPELLAVSGCSNAGSIVALILLQLPVQQQAAE